MDKTCSFDGCNRPRVARGICRKHYCAWRAKARPEYMTHQHMKQRCHNPNSTGYHKYGAKGVKVCDRWRFGENGKTGYQCFLEDMGKKPSPKHSIDRVDPNGDYEPSNCRWATSEVQRLNQGLSTRNKSGYQGVSWCSDTLKWRAQIKADGRHIGLGYYERVEDASLAYQQARQRYYGAILNS